MRDLTNKDRAGPIDREHLNPANWQHRQDVYSQIERAFLLEVGNAEELAKLIEPGMFWRSIIAMLPEYAGNFKLHAMCSLSNSTPLYYSKTLVD